MRFAIIIIGILFQQLAYCQERPMSKKHYHFLVNTGVKNSIGQNKEASKTGMVNPNFDLAYYRQKKFNQPGYLIRASALYSRNEKFYFGIQGGLNMNFGEMYGSDRYTHVSVPAQVQILTSTFKIGSSDLLISIASGINIFRERLGPRTFKTGSITELGLLIKFRSGLAFSAGYIHQVDKGEYYVMDDPSSNLNPEIITYNTRKPQLYISLGLFR